LVKDVADDAVNDIAREHRLLLKQQNIERMQKELEKRRELVSSMSRAVISSVVSKSCDVLVEAAVLKYISVYEDQQQRLREEQRLEVERQRVENEREKYNNFVRHQLIAEEATRISDAVISQACDDIAYEIESRRRLEFIKVWSKDFFHYAVLNPCTTNYAALETAKRVERDYEKLAEEAVSICALHTVPIIQLNESLNTVIAEICVEEEAKYLESMRLQKLTQLNELSTFVVDESVLPALTTSIVDELIEIATVVEIELAEHKFQQLLLQAKQREEVELQCASLAIAFMQRNRFSTGSDILFVKIINRDK
jgi:hypothetical protein